MSDVAGGAVSFLILLTLLALRVPIGVAMLAVGCGGFAWIQGGAALQLLQDRRVRHLRHLFFFGHSAVPADGNVASTSGLSARPVPWRQCTASVTIEAAWRWRRSAPAPPSARSAALRSHRGHHGSGGAAEMRKYGYSGALATGTLAAGGTLGILVPPSIPLVVYAILTEQNIAKLFLAAFIPAG